MTDGEWSMPGVQVDRADAGDVERVLSTLTWEEKAALRCGTDAWHLPGVPRLGIGDIRVADCGHGITIMGEESVAATCFPTGIGMASTWNPDLLEEAGAAIGRDARALGISMVLGPKLNLHRVPINGRSFETFSEDPWLAGVLGAAVARGIQREGVGACIKAIAANSQQADQEVISSDVSEPALRELYLRQFQLAVELANPAAIMTSYNRINGIHPSEDAWLLAGIVKGEWGFDGVLISDWRAVHSPRALTSGLDVEMPGPGKWLDASSVRAALERGLISQASVDDSARRVLRLLLTHGRDPEPARGLGPVDSDENRSLALRVAEESIVLLRNEGRMLPLRREEISRILVVGPNAASARLGGGGSASVTPPYAVSPLDGIREALDGAAEVAFMEGCGLVGSMSPPTESLFHRDAAGDLRPGVLVRYRSSDHRAATEWTPVPTTDLSWGWAAPSAGIGQSGYTAEVRGVLIPPESGRYEMGLASYHGVAEVSIGERHLGRISEESIASQGFEADYSDHYETGTFDLVGGVEYDVTITYRKTGSAGAVRLEWAPPGADGRAQLMDAAGTADAVVVCVGLSNMLEGGARDRDSLRLPEVQEALISDVAAANPNVVVVLVNGGPLDIPWATSVPALLEAWYPGQEGGRAIARILFGDVNPSGRLPDTFADQSGYPALAGYPGEDHHSEFSEGLLIGYRYLDAAGVHPQFPFGFGFGYTEFEIGTPSVTTSRPGIESPLVWVEADVRNVGAVSGAEVVQLYIGYEQETAERPVRQLRGFEKVELAPGENATVRFELGAREFEAWDAASSRWVVRAGCYHIGVGAHSRKLTTASIELRTENT